MNLYRLTMAIEDEVQAQTFYQAFLTFRDRLVAGFYGPMQGHVEFVEEIPEAEEATPP